MDKITRQSVLDLLSGDWANYVARFQSLPPAAQAAFLEKQGYKRLADLLSHIVGWWEVGLQSIQSYRSDPAARPPEIDVDSFNARAVEQVRNVSDEQEIEAFETARLAVFEIVKQLPDDAFEDERVPNQFKWDLFEHLEEHRIE